MWLMESMHEGCSLYVATDKYCPARANDDLLRHTAVIEKKNI